MAFWAERVGRRRERALLARRSSLVLGAAVATGALLLAVGVTGVIARTSEATSFVALLGASLAGMLLLVAIASVALWRRAQSARTLVAMRRARPRETEDARTIAHDLRAPLATVSSYLDLLVHEQFGPMPPAALDAARRAAQASARLQQVIEASLLHEVRTIAGEPMEGSVASLDEVMSDVLAGLSARLDAAGAEVSVASLPQVRGDAALLSRVFQNLVENALKYHAPGEPPRVAVTASIARDRGEIVVRDYGIGIPAGERDRVFERSARGTNGAERSGHGLGLATVRRLVAEMGGDASVDPTVTSGLAVRISLPLA
jgi:two-component system, sensor histidine kinase and response regulator